MHDMPGTLSDLEHKIKELKGEIDELRGNLNWYQEWAQAMSLALHYLEEKVEQMEPDLASCVSFMRQYAERAAGIIEGKGDLGGN